MSFLINTLSKLLLLLVFFMLTHQSVQAQFVLSGEIRPRAEYRNGYQKLPGNGTTFAAFINQRTRVNLHYKQSLFQTYISVQDIRVWGEEKLKADIPSLGVHQAWGMIKLTDSIDLKIGRQALIYDNERLLSNNNWRQTAQVHDACVFKSTYAGWKIDLGGAYNQHQENIFGTDYIANSIAGNYKILGFLWVGKNFSKINISMLALTDANQKLNSKNLLYCRGTYGSNLIWKLKNTEIAARGYFQNGRTPEGKIVKAFYLNPDLSILILRKFKPAIGVEMFSGDEFSNRGNIQTNAFNGLFGVGHNFNGHMDYFTEFPTHANSAGLLDGYIKSVYSLNDKVQLRADYHYFMLAKEIENNRQPNLLMDKFLGHEVDASALFKISSEIQYQLGYSFLLGTETLEVLKGGNSNAFAHWAFVMLTFKPTFYNSDKSKNN